MNSIVFNEDCMTVMSRYVDKYFDIAIVDPPYGIDKKIQYHQTGTAKNRLYSKNRWDKTKPDELYWKELLRVSKNQIVFGGNYFTEFLPASRGWYVWHKLHESNLKYSHVELIWTSFDVSTKIKQMYPDSIMTLEKSIHPTQKPIGIYKWLLNNFAKDGYKIIDTHLGSGSSRIACSEMNIDFIGCEINKEYFNQSQERYIKYKQQKTIMFDIK